MVHKGAPEYRNENLLLTILYTSYHHYLKLIPLKNTSLYKYFAKLILLRSHCEDKFHKICEK